MKLSIIVAIGKSNQIGLDNRLLWHLPADLKNFKKITTGHHILMGRFTHQSIGFVLPKRENIILSKDKSFRVEKAIMSSSIEGAIKRAKDAGEDELFVIGGGKIYEQLLPYAHNIYLTHVDYDGDADTYFPKIDYSLYDSKDQSYHEMKDELPAWSFEKLVRKS